MNAHAQALVRDVIRSKLNSYPDGEREARRDLARALGSTEKADRAVARELTRLGGGSAPVAASTPAPTRPVARAKPVEVDTPRPKRATPKLQHVESCYAPQEHEHVLGKPSDRDVVARAAGMPPALAGALTDIELLRIAPAFGAMKARAAR